MSGRDKHVHIVVDKFIRCVHEDILVLEEASTL